MKLRQIFAALIISVAGLVVLNTPVYAQESTSALNVCTFIKPLCDAIGLTTAGNNDISSGGAREFIGNRLRLLLFLVFVGIILLSVVIILQNGIKYIQSQGDAKKIEDAQKAIKTVFVGIGILFVGTAGLVLVLLLFNASNLLTPSEQDGGCVIVDPLTLELDCKDETPTGTDQDGSGRY